MTWIANKAWCCAYLLEEMRERAQATRNLWAQAFACIGLAILRGRGC